MIAPINDVQPRLRFNDGMFWRKNNSITKHNTTVDLINNGLSEIEENVHRKHFFWLTRFVPYGL